MAAVVCLAGGLGGCAGTIDVPLDVSSNLPFVVARIGESAPLSFIVDTGASTTVIDRARADALGIDVRAGSEATTAGGSVRTGTVGQLEIDVGGTDLLVSPIAIDLAPLRAGLGRPVDGILGYDFFAKHVVEIDYASRRLRLHDPARYTYSGNGIVVPMTFEEQIPFIRLRVSGAAGATAEATVELDTGYTGALTLVGAFLDEQGVVPDAQPRLPISTGALLPGRVSAYVTRLQGIGLGSLALAMPVVNIAPDQISAGIEGDTAGLVGGDVLRRFTVIVDYTRQRVILEPNTGFGAPFEFDMSGMSLAVDASDGSVFRVRTTIPGTPAAEAGIAAGDLVTAIDGRPVKDLTLDEMRRLLRKPDERYLLTIRRGEAVTQKALTTRRLI